MKTKLRVLIYILTGIIIGVTSSFIFFKIHSNSIIKTTDDISKYPLLAKRILIENPNDVLIAFSPLRNNLRKMVEPWGKSFSFYFEYLPTGTSIGVNEKMEYEPRSLVKVPLVMAFYYVGSRQGLDFNPIVNIKPEEIDKGEGDLWMKGAGYQISLKEAVRLALVNSDNTAAQVISSNILLSDYQEMFLGLDIPIPENKNLLKLSTKQYSSILKALFFSSILDKDSSEEILKLLTESQLEYGLKSGVDSKVLVANKVGILTDQLYQDCGIVYFPKRPYLLCMFSQFSEKVARERMKTISKMVYEYMAIANGVGKK